MDLVANIIKCQYASLTLFFTLRLSNHALGNSPTRPDPISLADIFTSGYPLKVHWSRLVEELRLLARIASAGVS
jgi:hypothetical protein